MTQTKKTIFNKKKLKYQIEKVNFNDISDFQHRIELVKKWIGFVNSVSFYKSKETELQGDFLFDIFGRVLGYSSKSINPIEWNLNQEQVTTGGKFADGSLGYYSAEGEIIRVVIELKDANTNLDERQNRHNDNRTPVEQAFGYQHKIGKDCKWVIVSNFNEIRLYHHSSSIEYEQFFIKELSDEEKLKRFFFLLGKENLISKNGISVIDSLFISNEQDEQEITKKFYAAFKEIRLKFFDHLKTNNPTIDENILLEKTQKLLDRFIFICFAEDNRLLPETIFKNMVKTAKLSFTYSDTKVWTELKGLFNAINVGSPPHNINKFNGGLFAADEVLDSLQIKDQILEELSSITDYDFESDVSIDILGHIFEQSISDLEEIKASINGEVFEKSKSKRKRDGIVYTPAYITRDIVEKAVGGWLEDRKIELGYYDLPELTDEDYKSIINNRGKLTYNDKIKQHLELWYAYRERLMNIKVLDPACGSGAFLIQVFDYLYAEGNKVNDMIAKLLGGQYEVFQLDKHILSNNIYGVDINSESVEITKLSLWLKTANKNAELTSLDNNIKCGNSLIDDPEVAGDKAFDWNTEFAEIMQDKIVNEELKAYHVTWATYNSRPVGFTNNGSPIILDDETRNQIAEYLDQKIGVEHYRVIAINVMKDHVHCIVVCKEDDLSEIVRNLKGFSSYKLHRDSSSAHQNSFAHPKLKLGVDTGSSTETSTTLNPTLQRGANEEGSEEHESSTTINPTLQRGANEEGHVEYRNAHMDTGSTINMSALQNTSSHPKLKLGVDTGSSTGSSTTINPALQRGETEEGSEEHESSTTINPTLQRGANEEGHVEYRNAHMDTGSTITMSAHQHSSAYPKLKLGVDTGSSIESSTILNPTLQRGANREGSEEHESSTILNPTLQRGENESSTILNPTLQRGETEEGSVEHESSTILNPTLQRGENREGSGENENSTTINPTLQRGENREGHVEHRNEHGEQDHNSKTPSQKLWAKGYSHTFLNDNSHYLNTIHYIDNNHLKHEQSQLEYKFQNLTPLSEAFAPVVVRGGFDVVVGNPPWGAAFDSKTIEYLKFKQFKDISYNSAYLFIELGMFLLNNSGYLEFIIPKGLSYVPNLTSMRKFLIENYQINRIIDASEVFLESGVELESIIIEIAKMKTHSQIQTGYICEKQFHKNDPMLNNKILNEKIFAIWINSRNISIVNKVQLLSIDLGSICTSRRGININKHVSDAKSENIVLGGRNISRYYIDYFSYSPNDVIKENFKWQLCKKIMLQEIVGRYGAPLFGNYRRVKLNASIDLEGIYYSLDTVVNLFNFDDKFNIKYVLSIINSKLVTWYFHIYQKAFSQLTIHSGNENSRNIPILPLSLEAQQPFITLADTMLDKNKDLQEKNNKFQELLKADFNIEKLNTKLENWYNLSWAEFVNELKKLKVTLSGEMKEDWIERFNRYKSQITELQNIIQTTDKKIDQLVYELYGLSEEEIKVVEGE